jgi:signal transduction protein with GAF and PtsI domain
VATFSYGATERLVTWYLARFPGAPESEPYRLLQGLPTVTAESARRLWELGRLLPSDAVSALEAREWDRPNWTPLFSVAAGLVTEVGGSLCHAAVVARECRLPTVVGTHTATRSIGAGQIVEVDGREGVVRLF